ncbi:MAG TPA: phosphoglycerate dehydrogenase [Bdellovibrionales bacterium]|nr:phosphoglycerate dehydrogenase [Bdellovibrionales bacterium]
MSKTRILLLEGIHPKAKDLLENEGFDVRLESASPSEADLNAWLKEVSVVGIRSKTQLTDKVLTNNRHIDVIGAFCIGTDQVDLSRANALGMPVFNAPYSNTRSVAELVIAEVICLARQLGDRSMKAHQGEWLKSAEGSREVRGKTLGLVGYGHIGSQVSVLAEGLGLRVIYYDLIKKLPLGNSQPVRSLGDLLEQSDFVSLHVPDTLQTRNLIGASELSRMKKGAHLINASRGTVVNIPELAKALRSGHIGGAAVDVFPQEPASNKEKFASELQGIPNVILTPHIGGSTLEAQEAIGLEVAHSFIAFLKTGSTRGAVNFPNVDLPVLHKDCHRIVNVHKNVPGVLSDINGIVSEIGGNIEAQSLHTDPAIGYMVMDMGKAEASAVAARISQLPTSIKTRFLF